MQGCGLFHSETAIVSGAVDLQGCSLPEIARAGRRSASWSQDTRAKRNLVRHKSKSRSGRKRSHQSLNRYYARAGGTVLVSLLRTKCAIELIPKPVMHPHYIFAIRYSKPPHANPGALVLSSDAEAMSSHERNRKCMSIKTPFTGAWQPHRQHQRGHRQPWRRKRHQCRHHKQRWCCEIC